MRCPKDGTTLETFHRNGVEIERCPTCRGVWLDRGELDKIIAASIGEEGSERYNREKDKRSTFVGELFDF